MAGKIVTFAIGFALMVAYCPALSGATTTLRWDVAALIGLALFFAAAARMTRAHWLGLALIAWLAVSIAWSSAPNYGVNTAAQLLACAVAFAYGATLDDVRPLVAGAAAGLAISSLIAIAQWLGWHGIEQYGYPAGLFYNGNRLAEVAVIVFVAAFALRMWWAILPLAPAILLPQARGAEIGLAAAMLVYLWGIGRTFERFMMVAISALLALLYAMLAPILEPAFKLAAAAERLDLWAWTIGHLDALGHGLGSFGLDSPVYPGPSQAQYPHNEILWLAYEGGLPAVVLAAGFAYAVWRAAGEHPLRLVLVAFGVVALVAMPVHDPATVLFTALCAGHLAGADGRVRAAHDARGPSLCGGAAAAAV
jgi:hypothetical protein